MIERFKVMVDDVEFLGAEPCSETMIANKLDSKFTAHSLLSFFPCLLTNSPQCSTPRGKGFAAFRKWKSLLATPMPEGSSSSKRPCVMVDNGNGE